MNYIITPNNNSVTSLFGRMKRYFMDVPWYVWTIVTIGLALRIYQITLDMPLVLYPDESTFVARAVYCGTGELNPHVPWAFFVYALLALYVVLTGIGFLLGVFHSASDVARLYFVNPSFFYVSGRILSALAGTATIYITYLLGRSVYSKKAGIAAALFLTFLPTHITYSHLAVYDIPATLFILLAIWRIFQMSDADASRNPIRDYLVTGFLVGISITIKASAFLLIVPFLASHAIRTRDGSKSSHIRNYVLNRTLYIGFAAILLGMFIGSPFFFIDYRNGVMTYPQRYIAGQVDPFVDYSREGYIMPHITMLINEAGYPLTAVIIISFLYIIASLCWKRKQTGFHAIVLSFVGAYIIALAYFTRKVERDMLPITPLLMLFAGVFIDDAMVFLRVKFRRIPSFFDASVYTLLVIVLLAFPIRNTLHIEREFAKVDTRNVIGDWVRQNIPPGTAVAAEAGIKIHPDVETIREKMRNLEALGSGKARQLIQAYSYYLETGLPQQGYKLVPTTQHDLNLFAIQLPKDYQIDRFNDTKYFIFLQENIDSARENPQKRYRLPLYEWVQRNAVLVKNLKPDEDMKGPEILVFKRFN